MTSTAKTLQKAVRLHKRGELGQAEKLYQQIVRVDPDHADALHLLGVAAHQRKQSDVAVDCISRAIALNGSAGMYHANLGQAYLALKKNEEAADSFREAVRLEPGLIDGHLGLAKSLKLLKRLPEAEECLRRILAVHPDNAKAWFTLAELLKEQHRHDQAIECYRRVLQIRPNDVLTHVSLGYLLAAMGRFDEAIDNYEQALCIDPDRIDVLVNLGSTYKLAERYDDAIRVYRRALELNPRFAEVHVNLGNVFQVSGDVDKAIAEYRKAFAINPDCADAHLGMGVILKELDRFAEAASCFEAALKIRPNSTSAYNQLGLIQRELSNVADARECYESALDIQPGYAEARFNRSLVLLLTGDFDRGWDEYEWRWKRGSEVQRDFGLPNCENGPLNGRSVVIAAEQGLGDEIMFAGYLPEVINQSRHCWIECDPRLVPLFARSFPSATVYGRPSKIDQTTAKTFPQADLQATMGSLPRLIEKSSGEPTNESEIPTETTGYLIPNPDSKRRWTTRFEEFGKTLRVGISWRGGKEPEVKRKRSTSLEQWQSLLSTSGISFVNLQYGETATELSRLKMVTGVDVFDWDDIDPLIDLDNYAAEISALDLVISVDNSTVHLAGALGVPVWTLLPFAADWRWMLDCENSRWYPSMRLFRQPRRGDWNEVFNRVAGALSEIISSRVVG